MMYRDRRAGERSQSLQLRWVPSCSFFFTFPDRYCEVESRTFAYLRLNPYPAAMTFHYLLTNRKTNACAWVLGTCVFALEHFEDMFHEFRSYAYPIVFYGEKPFISSLNSRYCNTWFLFSEFNSITEEVLKQLNQL